MDALEIFLGRRRRHRTRIFGLVGMLLFFGFPKFQRTITTINKTSNSRQKSLLPKGAAVSPPILPLTILSSTATNSSAEMLSLLYKNTTCTDWSSSSAALIETIREHSQNNYPTSTIFQAPVINQTKGWFFPELDSKLIHEVFQKRKTVFMGDSTLFYLKDTLAQMVYDAFDTGGKEGTTMSKRIAVDPHTQVSFVGYRGVNMRMNCDLDHIWNAVKSRQPDILVVNWGFHMLHAFELGREVKLCNIDQWIHYETYILQRAIEVLAALDDDDAKQQQQEQQEATSRKNTTQRKQRSLLFKTNNYLCHDKNKQIANTDKKVQTGDERFFKACKDSVNIMMEEQPEIKLYPDSDQQQQREIHLSPKQVEVYCWNGAFQGGGSQQLQDRMIQFLETQKDKIPKHLTVAVYNDHDLESCAYTGQGDGRHYQALNVPRIRLMAHQVSCLLPKQ